MRAFLLGLATGVLATSAVFLLSAPAEPISPVSSGPAARASLLPLQLQSPPAAIASAPVAAALGQQVVGAPVMVKPAAAAPPQANAGLAQGLPVSLSEEHRALIGDAPTSRPRSVKELHHQLAFEPKDSSWSTSAELAIRQFLAEQAPSPEFEVLSVECRLTLCEIQAFGNLPGSSERWQSIAAAMGEQSWWSSFSGASTSSSSQNGRAAILTLLQRRQS